MKNIFLIVNLLIGVQANAALFHIKDVIPAHALREGGSAVGNGGGTVVCRDPSTRVIKSAELLDYFEARVIRSMNVDISKFPGSWKEKVQAVIDRLGVKSELRLKIYSLWLNTFEKETKFLNGIEFSKTMDSMHIGVPAGCEFEQAVIQIQPRFAEDHRYYINQSVWDALDENNKAGLVLHELIYREALSYGHIDSIAARYFNSFVSSSNMENTHFSDFIRILQESHFEETDIALKDPDFSMIYMTKHIWRPGSEENFYQEIEFKSRVVFSTGRCADEGCKIFHKSDSLPDTNSPLISNLTVDRGLKEIKLGEWRFYNENISEQSENNWWMGPALHLIVQFGKLQTIRAQSTKTIDHLLKLMKITSDCKISDIDPVCFAENVAHIHFDRSAGIHLSRIISQGLTAEGLLTGVGNGVDGAWGCKMLDAQFYQGRIASVDTASEYFVLAEGCDSKQEHEISIALAPGTPYSARLFGKPQYFSNQHDNNRFIFDTKTSVLSSTQDYGEDSWFVGINSLRFESGWKYTNHKNSAIFPSIHYAQGSPELGRVYQLKITEPIEISFNQSYQMDVLPQKMMELYPNGAPKSVTLAHDHQLRSASGGTKNYRSGSVLTLDDQGRVIKESY